MYADNLSFNMYSLLPKSHQLLNQQFWTFGKLLVILAAIKLCARIDIFILNLRLINSSALNLLFLIESGIVSGVYRPLEHNDLHCFFKELTKAISKTIEFYKNFILIDDLKIDATSPTLESDKLDGLVTLFNLKNLITSKTFTTETH